MPGVLKLIRGPAGGGKSQRAQRLIDEGAVDAQADYTALWAAVRAVARGPDGKYPTRTADDPSVPMVSYLKAVVAREAVARGLRILVTTSTGGDDEVVRWREVATAAGASFDVETVDPGPAVARARLANPETGAIAPECAVALRRWYSESELSNG